MLYVHFRKLKIRIYSTDHGTASLTCSTQPDAVKQDVFVRKSNFDMHPGFTC